MRFGVPREFPKASIVPRGTNIIEKGVAFRRKLTIKSKRVEHAGGDMTRMSRTSSGKVNSC